MHFASTFSLIMQFHFKFFNTAIDSLTASSLNNEMMFMLIPQGFVKECPSKSPTENRHVRKLLIISLLSWKWPGVALNAVSYRPNQPPPPPDGFLCRSMRAGCLCSIYRRCHTKTFLFFTTAPHLHEKRARRRIRSGGEKIIMTHKTISFLGCLWLQFAPSGWRRPFEGTRLTRQHFENAQFKLFQQKCGVGRWWFF